MNTFIVRAFVLTGLLGSGIFACDPVDPVPTGQFALRFDNVVGEQDLQLGSGTYRNGAGDEFTPTAFNYYVSNLKLIRTDGIEYVVPQDSSYFLVRENVPGSQRITLNGVPYGDYRAVSFVIGVDSLRSTMDISRRTGVLDPGGDHASASGMYWAWNSGYIFMKLEGTSPSAPVNATGIRKFQYHIGLYGGRQTPTLNNLKTVQISFAADRATVGAGTLPTVNLRTDVLKVFDGPTTVRIATHPDVMISDYSGVIAGNYAQMFGYKNTTISTVAVTK